jgi:ribosomal protein S18 acetylase RimI-like enzyme
MDKLVRKIEVPLAKNIIQKAGLYLVPEERIGELADVAMDAYLDYPLHNWFCGGTYDAKTSHILMDVTLKTMVKDGVIYADSEELNGFAVWMPLGFTGNATLPFLRYGGLSLVMHSGPGIIGQLLTYENFAMNLKQKYTNHVDWYLYNLCVSRKAQGKGIASKLMRPMLDFCDREKMVCYLETNKESNVSLYQHYGFQLAEQKQIPKSNVMHYAMTREPKDI